MICRRTHVAEDVILDFLVEKVDHPDRGLEAVPSIRFTARVALTRLLYGSLW